MKTIGKWNLLRTRNLLLVLAGLYGVNYLVTPSLVNPVELQVHFRPHFRQKFDSETWKQSGWLEDGGLGKPSPSFGRRYEMVDDLLDSRVLVGLFANQMKNILGDPDAGVMDKAHLLANPNPYGGDKLNAVTKEILESPDPIALWAYHLAPQRDFPAKSVWFPFMFESSDNWKLVVQIRSGKVWSAEVSF